MPLLATHHSRSSPMMIKLGTLTTWIALLSSGTAVEASNANTNDDNTAGRSRRRTNTSLNPNHYYCSVAVNGAGFTGDCGMPCPR